MKTVTYNLIHMSNAGLGNSWHSEIDMIRKFPKKSDEKFRNSVKDLLESSKENTYSGFVDNIRFD